MRWREMKYAVCGWNWCDVMCVWMCSRVHSMCVELTWEGATYPHWNCRWRIPRWRYCSRVTENASYTNWKSQLTINDTNRNVNLERNCLKDNIRTRKKKKNKTNTFGTNGSSVQIWICLQRKKFNLPLFSLVIETVVLVWVFMFIIN